MRSPSTSPTMVGRARELEAVRQAHAATLPGTPRGVVVAGEAGIGKTRLLEEFVHGLGTDVVVARGQCVARGSLAAPFAPLRELLRDLLSHFGREVFLRSAGPTGRLLPALLPELAADGEPGEIAQAQLYDAVSLLLENLSAAAPLVVLVEDLHWADPPTLDLLRELLHVFRRGRVLVGISYRSDDVGRDHPLRPFLQEVARSRDVTRVELERLTAEEAVEQARLIRDLAMLDDDLVTLVRRSDGVPFLVEELLAVEGVPEAPLPTTLRELVLARYSRLPDETRAVLRLAAAGGVTVEHDLLATVHQDDPAALDRAMRQAVDAQVLRAHGTAYTFRHALTQEAVHGELLPGERARVHARYATALENGHRAPGRSAEIAHHWLAAHEPSRALSALVAASAEAATAGAPVSSAQLGEEALALWDQVPDATELAGSTRIDLVRRLALTYATAGHPRAAGILDEELAVTPDDDPRGRALLLHDAMMVRHGSGREGFLELGHRALALLPTEDDDQGLAVRARVQCGLACAMLIAPEPGGVEMMREAMDLARDLARRSTDPELVERARFELRRGLTNLAWELYRTHDAAGALASLHEVESLIGADAQARLRHADRASRICFGLGRLAEARELATTGMEFAREVGMERGWGTNLAVTRARASLALGDLPATAEILRQVRQSRPYDSSLATCAALEIELAVAADDLAAAERIRHDAHDLLERVRATEIDDDLSVAIAVGGLAAARGDTRAAWAEVGHLWTREDRFVAGYVYPLVALGARLLAAMRRVGLEPPGGTSAEGEARLRATLEAHGAYEVADDWRLVVDAELSGPDGSGSDVDAWSAAVRASAQGRVPLSVRVDVLRMCARAQLGAGQREAGARTLAEARAAAEASGLRRAARLAGELAEQAGVERPDGDAGRGESGHGGSRHGVVPGEAPLTARERQVLELVAQGLTNRQIGEQLFISAKTASVHVSAILRKLGVATRAQAAARAVDALDG